MKEATSKDKGLVVEILSHAFAENKSVNYIIPEGRSRQKRIAALMDYSFEVCMLSGCVYLSDDEKGCALISFPDQKKTSLRSIFLDLRLIGTVTGFKNIQKVLNREKAIAAHHPDSPMYYLWFIGVLPQFQNQGTGKTLLREILTEAKGLQRPVYLETSTEKNVPWYQHAGFEIYNQMDFGYTLYMLKKEAV